MVALITLLAACGSPVYGNDLEEDVLKLHTRDADGPGLSDADVVTLKDLASYRNPETHKRIDLFQEVLADDYIDTHERRQLGFTERQIEKFNHSWMFYQYGRLDSVIVARPEGEELLGLMKIFSEHDYSDIDPMKRYEYAADIESKFFDAHKLSVDADTVLYGVKLYLKLGPDRPITDKEFLKKVLAHEDVLDILGDSVQERDFLFAHLDEMPADQRNYFEAKDLLQRCGEENAGDCIHRNSQRIPVEVFALVIVQEFPERLQGIFADRGMAFLYPHILKEIAFEDWMAQAIVDQEGVGTVLEDLNGITLSTEQAEIFGQLLTSEDMSTRVSVAYFLASDEKGQGRTLLMQFYNDGGYRHKSLIEKVLAEHCPECLPNEYQEELEITVMPPEKLGVQRLHLRPDIPDQVLVAKTQSIDSRQLGNRPHQIRTDGKGRHHVVYYNGSAESLCYANNVNGEWQVYALTKEGSGGELPSLDVDRKGAVHIAYFDRQENAVTYVSNSSGDWYSQVIDDTSGAAVTSGLQVDQQGYVHIVYYDSVNKKLRHATNNSGEWEHFVVDPEKTVSKEYSTQISSDGVLHISYNDEAEESLFYATYSSGDWDVQKVTEQKEASSQWSDLAIDSLGKAHIVYYDKANTTWRYAENTSGQWRSQDWSQDPTIGDVDIQVDANGRLHLFSNRYKSKESSPLVYTTNASGSWDSVVVADGVTAVNTLAFSFQMRGEKLYVSYIDLNSEGLKLASVK